GPWRATRADAAFKATTDGRRRAGGCTTWLSKTSPRCLVLAHRADPDGSLPQAELGVVPATNSYWSFAHLCDFAEEFTRAPPAFAIVASFHRVFTPQRAKPMKTLRHPPSKELWKFCMERLRELRGPDTRERDLANILGFEHSRAVRWREGQMYVDRGECLVRLADALDVEPMLMVAMASGTLTVEQAHRQIGGAAKDVDGKRRRGHRAEPLELASDASLFALDPSKFDGGRGVVLLIAANGEGRAGRGRGLARAAG